MIARRSTRPGTSWENFVFLFLPTTKRQLVPLGVVCAFGLCLALVLVVYAESRPHGAAEPSCATFIDTATTTDCLAQIDAWCKTNKPTEDPSQCRLEVVREAAPS
jgi:hypothetical protein